MIILSATTHSLVAVLDGAPTTTQPRALVSFRDITTTTYTPTSTATQLNGATPVTLCAAPSASHQSVIDFVSVFNGDTDAVSLTISFDISGTLTTLWRGVLAAEETLTFTDAGGWMRTVPAVAGAYVGTNGAITVPTIATPVAPTAGNLSFYAREYAGRAMLAQEGPSGLTTMLQPAFARNKIAIWNPPGNATTVPGVLGLAAMTAVGTATSRSVATTSRFTRARRLGYVSAAGAGSLTSIRTAAAQFTVGTGTGDGGFFFAIQFGCSDAATVAGARQFLGLWATTTAPTNVEPSTLVNAFGIGNGASDTNLKLFYGGSVAQTPINLGANFPANTLSSDWYEMILFASPNNTSVNYRVERLNTGDVASGTFPGVQSAAIPASTTLLGFSGYRTNNATALAVGIDIGQIYIETDF